MTGSSWGITLFGLGAVHLLYTYVGYPWIVSRLPERPPSPSGRSRPQLISVIIAAGGGNLAGKVRNLLQTITLPAEIIVVVDGPDAAATSGLAEISDRRVRVEVLPQRQGKAVALNRAVELSRGDVLVFTDVRQQIAPGAVEALVDVLASPDMGAVSGALEIETPAGGESLYERYWRLERRLRCREAALDSAVGVSGALYALKREFWRPLPRGLLLDDVWVPFQVVRAGKRVGFALSAVATDTRSPSDAIELARKVRTLTGNYQLISWMPSLLLPSRNRIWWQFMSHKVLRLMTPLAVGCVIAGGLLIVGPWDALAGALGLVVVTLGWKVSRNRRTPRHHPSPRPSPQGPGIGFMGTARSAVVLCAALIMAAANAMRGRWDVWIDARGPGAPT
ncbi:MAG TPA: glycosyltransferase [Gemmatimonadales bacterium]|nr:glycosyltransferase [Gemmatimonadales bacterium]